MSWLFALAFAADDGQAGLEAYMARRLDVVERPVSTVYAKAYDGSGTFWFVQQGGRGIEVVDFAALVGDTALSQQVRGRRRRQTGLGALATVAGIGLGGLAVVLPTLSEEGSRSWGLTAAVGAPALLGVVGGTVLVGRGLSNRHPSAAYTKDEAVQRAQAYNAALADEVLVE